MSLPAFTPILMSPVDGFLQIFNTNPYFIGIMMLVLNLGGRFINLEVTKQQELFLQHPWVRRFLIFVVLFVATRNVYIAFWATVTVVLFLGYLFNENSALCLFGTGVKGSICSANANANTNENQNEMTPEEKEILQRLHAKSMRFVPKEELNEDAIHMDIYAANMALLRK
jgi:hypothetical protein